MGASKKKEEKIRVHNKGSRVYEYRNEKGEIKKIEPGRAVEISETKAKKLIADYPRDLINFEDMLSGDRKDINKENKRLKKENAELRAELKKYQDAENTVDPAKEEPNSPEDDTDKGGE